MTNALDLPIYIPEMLLATLITIESFMLFLLIKYPNTGIIWSALLMIFFAIFIGILQAIGIHEICGCFGNLISGEVGIAKILQNLGLAFLLISSWYMRKEEIN